MIFASTLINWGALGEAFLYAAVFAIGVVVVMSSGIHLYSRSEGRFGAQKVINLAGAIIALLIVLAVVGLPSTNSRSNNCFNAPRRLRPRSFCKSAFCGRSNVTLEGQMITTSRGLFFMK